MHPSFKIEAESGDITEALKKRLISLRFTDEDGFSSDELEITLDDRENLALPGTGEKLKLWLGYEETGLVYMGEFSIQAMKTVFPPRRIVLRARAADLRKDMKLKRTKSWDNVHLSDVAHEISENYELELVYQAETDPFYEHLAQTEESDLHLLTRLSQEAGLSFSVKNGKLIFVSKKKRPEIELDFKMVLSGEFDFDDRPRYKGVKAVWWDEKTATERKFELGEEPFFVLKRRFKNEDEARTAAEGKLDELSKQKVRGRIRLVGDAKYFSGAGIIIGEGFKQEERGKYVINRVEHYFSSSGYTTTLEVEGYEG